MCKMLMVLVAILGCSPGAFAATGSCYYKYKETRHEGEMCIEALNRKYICRNGTWLLQGPCKETARKGEKKEKEDFVKPIITTETMPNAPGEYSLRLSGEYGRLNQDTTIYIPKAQIFFGLSERVGGELNFPFVLKPDAGNAFGMGDISLGLKILLAKHKSWFPALSAELELKFPTGDPNNKMGFGLMEYAAIFAFLKDFSVVNIQGNIALSVGINPVDGKRELKTLYHVSLALPLWVMILFLELDAAVGQRPEQNRLALAPGFKYHITETMFMALSVPIGLNATTESFRVIAQIQFGL